MRLVWVLPILLTAGTTAWAGEPPVQPTVQPTVQPKNVNDLFWVRSVSVVNARFDTAQPDPLLHLREALRSLPGVTQAETDEADLLIEYDESTVPDEARTEPRAAWHAHLFRLDCQSASFYEKPTRAINGHCERRIYVRVDLGSMSGVSDGRVSAAEDFASKLKEAILCSQPTASPVSTVRLFSQNETP
jgi:hypothetical protein